MTAPALAGAETSAGGRPTDALAGRVTLLCLAGAVAASLTVLLILQSRLTFVGDDWRFLLQRRGLSVGAFLRVHGVHIVIGPVAVYKALLGTFGMGSALPFQVVSTLVFAVSVVVLFAYVRQRVGDWPALLASTLILFLGAAWGDLLWSFQIGFSGSIAAGIGALMAVQRNDRKGDVLAAVLLVVSTSFSELGVPFSLGVLAGVVLGPAPRRRRLYVALVPLALYGVWYLGWGRKGANTVDLHNFVSSPSFVFDSVSQNLASLVGLATPLSGSGSGLVGLNWGRILLVVAIAVAVRRLRHGGTASTGLWIVLVAGGSFWFLSALNAVPVLRTPTTSRYQYPGAVFVVLIAAELLREAQLGKRALIAATGVTVAAAVSGLIFLHDGYRIEQTTSDLVRARLAAVEIARGHQSPNYVIAFDLFDAVDARSYFSAVDAYGSPAFSEQQLKKASEHNRAAADGALAAAEAVTLGPSTNAHARPRLCQESTASSPPVALQPGTYSLQVNGSSAASLALARFADRPSLRLGALNTGVARSLIIPADRSKRPWRLSAAGPGQVVICDGPQR